MFNRLPWKRVQAKLPRPKTKTTGINKSAFTELSVIMSRSVAGLR